MKVAEFTFMRFTYINDQVMMFQLPDWVDNAKNYAVHTYHRFTYFFGLVLEHLIWCAGYPDLASTASVSGVPCHALRWQQYLALARRTVLPSNSGR